MIEYGTFSQLMAKKGLMAKLVSENVQVMQEPEERIQEMKRQTMSAHHSGSHLYTHSHPTMLPAISEISITTLSHDSLDENQFKNRQHVSRLNTILPTDENMAVLIEENQLLGQTASNHLSLIKEIQRSRLSIVSAVTSIEEIKPADAEPMKLVLEDQSVEYKMSPLWAYLKSGWGAVITLIIFAYFFLVHLLRILSGSLLKFYKLPKIII